MATLATVNEPGAQACGHPAGAAPARVARPVDLVHLSRFTLGSRDLEREVLQLFRVQSRLYLDRLRDAGDRAAWRIAAHTIKGSARGIGAWAVAQAAEAAELLPDVPQGKAALGAFETLTASVDEANAFIDELLAGH